MKNMNNTSPILDFSLSNPDKGMLFDTRDGQSYPVVKIGNQIWLAENFRYLPSKEKGDEYCNSWVYKNNNDYLDKGYGRFYDWNTANNIAPEGWRLPNNKDFEELKDFIIKDNNLDDGDEVGNYLKSVEDWTPWTGKKTNIDKYGFNAKPAGCYTSSSDYFNFANIFTHFWSNNIDDDSDNVSYLSLYSYNKGFYEYSEYKRDRQFSVRLIKSK